MLTTSICVYDITVQKAKTIDLKSLKQGKKVDMPWTLASSST